MSSQILVTKLFVPGARPELVPRPLLIKQLDEGIHRKLTLISAPAGFGKTTVVTEWIEHLRGAAYQEETIKNRITWLSLYEGDNDPARFLTYFIAALNQIDGLDSLGEGSLAMLSSPQPPPIEVVLTPLINELAGITTSDRILFVLDDYHLVDSQPIQDILNFLLENKPPQLHLVITTREDPLLPLPRLRARGQLTELRAADLRFTSIEAAEFLNQVMGLSLSPENIAALEARTEGWIAGLQLAAITLQGQTDISRLIQTFTGSNRLVLDFLIEEVLNQQSEDIQKFLLQTAILDRLTGSLCNIVTGQENGQTILEMLDRANLFIVHLDNERQWYRYHHLFADLLRQRLQQGDVFQPEDIRQLHIRASQWYEDDGMEIEAFHHAAAANDYERAERLIDGKGMPLSFRGVVTPVLDWFESLPKTILDSRPSLWVTYAMTELTIGRSTNIEEKLQIAEAALEGVALDTETRDIIGRIANIRANVAVGYRQTEVIMTQSQRALEYLHPDNLTFRTAALWKLGVAHEFQGDRSAAKQAFTEAISISQASGNIYTQILATVGLANIQLAENQLHLAAETYRSSLDLVGDLPIPVAVHVHHCLAQILYQWNDLDAAYLHGQESLQQTQPYKDQYDIYVVSQIFLARLKLAQGDVTGASAILAEADKSARQHNFVAQIPAISALQVRILLQQGNLAAAIELADQHELPLSQARVQLAMGNSGKTLDLLNPLHQQAETKNWVDKRLKIMALQAVAQYANDDEEQAMKLLGDVLALAEPDGFIRIFVDEGSPMARLLYAALGQEISTDYIQRLLAAFPIEVPVNAKPQKTKISGMEWVEPLSEREIEVLQLIAEGMSNQEIAAKLYLSLNTIKAHSQNIYGKLGVKSRTQASARARVLGLLSNS